MARKKTEAEAPIQFEEAMKRMEEVVRRLEAGDIPLEEALELYQEGVQLSRVCAQKLDAIETQISQILEEDGQVKQKPFLLEGDA